MFLGTKLLYFSLFVEFVIWFQMRALHSVPSKSTLSNATAVQFVWVEWFFNFLFFSFSDVMSVTTIPSSRPPDRAQFSDILIFNSFVLRVFFSFAVFYFLQISIFNSHTFRLSRHFADINNPRTVHSFVFFFFCFFCDDTNFDHITCWQVWCATYFLYFGALINFRNLIFEPLICFYSHIFSFSISICFLFFHSTAQVLFLDFVMRQWVVRS